MNKNTLFKVSCFFIVLSILIVSILVIRYERKLCSYRQTTCMKQLDISKNNSVYLLHPSYVNLVKLPSLDLLDQNLLQKGRREMLKHKLVIAGITRDNIQAFASIVRHLEYIGSFFKDYRIVLFENDSKDGTKLALKSWQENNPKVKIISQDFAQRKRPTIKFLADARNYYLDAITKEEYEDFDMVMMIDMDMEKGIDIRGIEDSFSKLDKWDAVCSNGVTTMDNLMHDMFAFRNDEFPWTPSQWEEVYKKEDGTGKWSAQCKKGKNSAEGDSIYWGNIIGQGTKKYPINSPLAPVYSCFGGMALYKRDFIKDCRYDSIDEDCEHVSFHQCLREKNQGRMVMNPNQVIRYD